MDSNTIRVFAFSGGSTKGYGENRFMQKFIAQWGIAQADLWKYVDVFAGVSIGAILACSYAFGKTPDATESFFREKAKRIFTIRTAGDVAAGSHNASVDSNRPNSAQKIGIIALNDAFYASAYPDSNYGHNILQQTLVDNFGTSTLADLHRPIVIPAVQEDLNRPVLFSNFNDSKYFIGNTEQIVNVCRASSAAYPYLPRFELNGHQYIDGAFLINTAIKEAINLGLTIKPNAKRIVVIDVGAGLGNSGFDDGTSTDIAAVRLFEYMNVLLTNAEENTRKYYEYLSERVLKYNGLPFSYYKFQPKFPEEFPNEIDNSTPEWFTELSTIIDAHYWDESDLISGILAKLTA